MKQDYQEEGKNVEEERQKAMDVNYKLGNYGYRYCSNCGYPIEEYKNIKHGLCEECMEDISNY
jgi:RNA polymerase-binding transcription factor DksA